MALLSLLHRHLWSLLEADATFASSVRPGGRVKLADRRADPFDAPLDAASLPRATLLLERVEPALSSGARSYLDAPSRVDDACYVEQVDATFTLTLVHEDLHVEDAVALAESCCDVFRNAGARLGFVTTESDEPVQRVGPATWTQAVRERDRQAVGNPDTLRRLVTVITLPVRLHVRRGM